MTSDTQSTKRLQEYDIFISHATQDKEDFVRPLATVLADLGVKVWYDEFSIDIGESISSSIDKGISHSRAGLVVLSDSFLEKVWTDYEFRGLLIRQMEEGIPIFPIWHNLSIDKLNEYSPSLKDKRAIKSDQGILVVAGEVIRLVRPDIRKGLELRLRFLQARESGKPEVRSVASLEPGPRRRERLSDGMMRRIRRVCLSLRDVLNLNFEQTYDSFLRDVNPEDELQHWEWLCLIMEIYQLEKECGADELDDLFRFLLMADFKKMIGAIDEQKAQELQQDLKIDVPLVVGIVRDTSQHPMIPEQYE
jgi:hypothetical protein